MTRVAGPKAALDSAYLAGSYARWRNSRLGQITDRLEESVILELLGPVESLNLLDVGCGDGAMAAALSRCGARVTGLDPDSRMLEAARRRAEAESLDLILVPGRAEHLPFADRTFDRVVAVAVLCFIPQTDRAIAEMARVLKPGGRLVIGELGRWSLWTAIRRARAWLGAPTWKAARFRTVVELRRLLERHGLTVREIRGSIYYPPFDLAALLLGHLDLWFGRQTTFGAAFIVLSATKTLDRAYGGLATGPS